MASSPIYNWPEPDDTSLVKNGALAMRTLGNAIDTTMATMVPKSIVDAKGDLIGATANDTPARLAVGTNGQVLTADSTAATGLAWATPSGGSNTFFAGKNKIINGDFSIWQRGTSFTSTGYTADRFTYTQNGSTCTVSQQTFTAGTAPVAGYEGQYFARCAVTSVAGASNYVWFRQLIENVRVFAGQPITISFWAKADGAKPISIEWEQNFGSGGSAAVQTFVAKPTLTTSWARYSYTIAVPSIAGKTLAASTWSHLAFWLDAGSTYNTRTSSLGQQNITFDVWGVQVEAGSTATDFVTASGGSPQAELAMCQRYYVRYSAADLSLGNYAQLSQTGFCVTTALANLPFAAPATLRTKPTSVDYANVELLDTQAISVISGGTFTVANGTGTQTLSTLYTHTAATLTAGKQVILRNSNNVNGYFGWSAEL